MSQKTFKELYAYNLNDNTFTHMIDYFDSSEDQIYTAPTYLHEWWIDAKRTVNQFLIDYGNSSDINTIAACTKMRAYEEIYNELAEKLLENGYNIETDEIVEVAS